MVDGSVKCIERANLDIVIELKKWVDSITGEQITLKVSTSYMLRG